jgi:hypothetical protein
VSFFCIGLDLGLLAGSDSSTNPQMASSLSYLAAEVFGSKPFASNKRSMNTFFS